MSRRRSRNKTSDRSRYPGDEVAEDIQAGERGHVSATVDEAADDGRAIVVAIFQHGIDQRRIRATSQDMTEASAGSKRKGAFLAVPAVILAGLHDVDFLNIVLPDVAGDQPAARGIEGEAKRIAQAIGINLVHGGAATDEGIACRDAILAVGAGRIAAARSDGGSERIDAQNFAEDRGEVLAVAGGGIVAVAGVIGRAAVA